MKFFCRWHATTARAWPLDSTCSKVICSIAFLWFCFVFSSHAQNENNPVLQAADVSAYTEKAWEEWKSKYYREYLKEPTSFLNAVSLAKANPSESLFLSLGKTPEASEWSKTPSQKAAAILHFHGTSAVLQRDGNRSDTTISRAKPKFEWKMRNGGISRIVIARKDSKLAWVYIFDPKKIRSFPGFKHYPFNPSAVVSATFHAEKPRPVTYRTFQEESARVFVIGKVRFQLQGKNLELNAYNWSVDPDSLQVKDPYIALIYTDARAGNETYAGGREVVVKFDKELPNKEAFVLDFNRTINFYCVYSKYWHCPIGLQEKLDLATEAGELLPGVKPAPSLKAATKNLSS